MRWTLRRERWELTSLNARSHDVSGRVRVLKSDLLSSLPEKVRVIAANLPYVMSAEIPLLEPEVRSFEPREALDGGDDGLLLIRRLLAEAGEHLLPGGAIVMEMDPRQIATATALASERFPGARIRSVRDLAGRERVVVVETA